MAVVNRTRRFRPKKQASGQGTTHLPQPGLKRPEADVQRSTPAELSTFSARHALGTGDRATKSSWEMDLLNHRDRRADGPPSRPVH